MFGIFGFLFACGFVNFPLLLVLLSLKRTKGRRAWLKAIGYLIMYLSIIHILGPHYYYKTKNYIFLKTLKPNEVASITIDSTTWTAQKDIQQIVEKLNQAVWHEDNHDGGGPFVPMDIMLYSGQKLYFRVGPYSAQDDGAIVEFFRQTNERASWEDGNTYIPGLLDVLNQLDYSLPPAYF